MFSKFEIEDSANVCERTNKNFEKQKHNVNDNEEKDEENISKSVTCFL